MSDRVDPRGFFVDLDELYKIASGHNSLEPSPKKLFEKSKFAENFKIVIFSTWVFTVKTKSYIVDSRGKFVLLLDLYLTLYRSWLYDIDL